MLAALAHGAWPELEEVDFTRVDRPCGTFFPVVFALIELLEKGPGGEGMAMPCRHTLKRVWVPMTRRQHRRLQALLSGVRTLWDEPERCSGWGAFTRKMYESDVWDDDEEEEEELEEEEGVAMEE